MGTDALIACPDPNCGARFKISRVASARFAMVTAPWYPWIQNVRSGWIMDLVSFEGPERVEWRLAIP